MDYETAAKLVEELVKGLSVSGDQSSTNTFIGFQSTASAPNSIGTNIVAGGGTGGLTLNAHISADQTFNQSNEINETIVLLNALSKNLRSKDSSRIREVSQKILNSSISELVKRVISFILTTLGVAL